MSAPSPLDAALGRVSFNLTYGRSPSPRKFHEDGLTGPSIDDAFREGQSSSGDWEMGGTWLGAEGDVPPDVSEDEWVHRFFVLAICEAAHEALEWFRVDGRTFLSPHERHETRILDESEAFARRLLALRNGSES